MKHIIAAAIATIALSQCAYAQVTYMWGPNGNLLGSAVTVPGGVTYYYDQTYNAIGTTTSSNPAQAPKAGLVYPQNPYAQPKTPANAKAWYEDDAEGEEE